MATIQIKRGLHANLPTSGMSAGEPLVTTDRGTLHVATDATTKLPIVPAVEALTSLGTMATDDLILIHDTSETAGQSEKKVTFDAFKTALNIPTGSSDELVAVASGGTAGYVWGTDGTDGIVRMGASMSWTKDAGSAFVTMNVSAVDGGSF